MRRLLLLTMCLAACDDASPAAGADAAAPAAWAVERLGDTWAVVPPHGGPPVLRLAAEAPVALGAGDPEVLSAFGAFRIDLDRMDWSATAGAAEAVPSDALLRLDWHLPDGRRAGLRFEEVDGGLAITVEGEADAGALAFACGDDESFFGLGAQSVGLDLRGRRYPLWAQEQGIGKPESGSGFPIANAPEASYAPMGVWHSSAGYTAVLGHDRFSDLDLCRDGRVVLRSLGAMPSIRLLPGATPRDRLRALGDLLGRPPAPPPWVFGPWLDSVGGPAPLHALADLARREGVPASAIWAEDWIGGRHTANGFRLSYDWSWDPATYPDLPGDVERLHARGFAVLGYFNPFVPETVPGFTEGRRHLVRGDDGEPLTFVDPAGRRASLVDLTSAEARAWLAGHLEAARALGLDGWMADFAEWLPVEARLASGEDGWAVHNRYPLEWQRAHAASGALFFARSGWASVNGGSAGLAPVMWGGDQNTDWGRDDGLPTVIPIAAHLGLAGVALFGSDVAGYSGLRSPPTSKELFFRWTSLAALQPVMRTHHGSDAGENWTLDRDAETLAHFRRWARVHVRLLPYLQALLASGLPLVRHPYLVDPDRPGLWRRAQDQFFLGDDVLVAPVVTEGAVERDVHLPGPGWWPLLGGPAVEGGEGPGGTVVARVTAPLTEAPAFVRPGTALPLLVEVPDTLYPATDPAVRGGRPGVRLALFPDAQGAVGGAGVDGGGFRAAPRWAEARVDGAPAPACPAPTCADAGALRLAGPATVEVGGATLRLEGEGPWEVRWGPAGAFD